MSALTDFPFVNLKKHYRKRMQKENELLRWRDVNKNDLSELGERARKRAKKTLKSMQHNKWNHGTIINNFLDTNGVTPSQLLTGEKQRFKDKSRKHHNNQDDVRVYRNVYETESDNE